MTVQTSSKNLCGSTFVLTWAGEEGKGWRELTKNSLEFKHDDQNKEYVTIKHTEQTKNNQGGSKQKDQDYTDMRMYGLPGSSMYAISSLKLMLSELQPDCEALFQVPLTKFSKVAVSVGTRTSPWERIPSPNLCPRFSKRPDFPGFTQRIARAITKNKNETKA